MINDYSQVPPETLLYSDEELAEAAEELASQTIISLNPEANPAQQRVMLFNSINTYKEAAKLLEVMHSKPIPRLH